MTEKEQTILLIDDDPRNIFALTAVLRSRGCRVLTAPSAQQGLLLLQKEKDISVVLLDMMMPDMDGYEVLKAIRTDESLAQVPVFAVTAQAMMGDRERCLQAGANEYISKPVDVDVLFDRLNAYKAKE